MAGKNPFLQPNFKLHLATKKSHASLLNDYFNLDISHYHKLLKQTSARRWQTLSQQKALHLFHLAARFIPAYKDFLKKNRIKANTIKSFSDFTQVPPTDKPNYIDQYPLEKLCWQGSLKSSNIISFSSGSMNKPYLWPRSIYQDLEGAFAFEHLLTYLFHIEKKSTLFVNCFSMGNYVAGVYVYTSVKLLALKGYHISIVSPGINYQDVFNILNPLKDKYDQIILAGYPPFIREIIELGIKDGFDFQSLNLKFFFASEFFTEDWRDQTLSKTGNRNPFTDSTNIYGTADSAIFSFETPTTILVRKLASQNIILNQALFNSPLLPTLTQYNPLLTLYETIKNELVLTTSSGICLIRYNLKDQGDTLTHSKVTRILRHHHHDLNQELQLQSLHSTYHHLPFVYLTNRTDGAVSFFGIKIFPEYIRPAIESPDLSEHLTGKFILISKYNRYNHPQLNIHIELSPHSSASSSVKHSVTQMVLSSLRKRCSEFSFLESSLGNKSHPTIRLHPYKTNRYFPTSIKQKWVKV